MKHRKPIAGAGALAVFTLSSFAVLAQDYDIRLIRPFKLGDRYCYTATGTERHLAEVTNGDGVIRNTEGQFSFELAAEAAAIDAAGGQAGSAAAKGNQSGEAKTVWVIPANFKGISPHEVITVPASSATPPPDVTVKTGNLAVGKVEKRVEPVYPPLAMQAKVAGKVVVEVIIDEEGNVIWAKANTGHPLLREAALEAARQWKYEPTTFDDTPVKILGTVTLNFGL